MKSIKDKLAEKEKQLHILQKVNQSLASGYMEHLLSLITSLVFELLDCDKCNVMILNDEKNELQVRAAHSLDPAFTKAKTLKVNKSLAGCAILEGRPLQWKDVREEKLFAFKEAAKRSGIKSMLAIPMMVNNKPLGVMNFFMKKFYRFKNEEIDFLQSIANQAALAIERSLLIESAKKSQQALAERKIIEKAKGILMKNKSLNEDEAYQVMRKKSMSSRVSLVEIAKAIQLSDSL